MTTAQDSGNVAELYSYIKGKGKAVPLQACSGLEGSRKLRFPDYMTTAQDSGKVAELYRVIQEESALLWEMIV
jgi:hypothetical protein